MDPTEEKTEHSALPSDDLKRTLKLAEPDKLSHIGPVGDTYTVTRPWRSRRNIEPNC
jgi:hypothetical protein